MRIIVLAVILTAVLAPGVTAQDDPDSLLYWTSAEATLALRDSDWAADRAVRFVTCRGRGTYRMEFGFPHYRQFRCALSNTKGRLVAHVTLTTTEPENFRLSALTNRLRVCR